MPKKDTPFKVPLEPPVALDPRYQRTAINPPANTTKNDRAPLPKNK
jgi:hypothetical protein